MNPSLKTQFTLAFCLLGAMSSRALADSNDIDMRSAEYIDVVETSDGSIWKGIVVEQTPNVQYKIATADGSLHVIKAADVVKLTKERNHDFQSAAHQTRGGELRDGGVGKNFETDGPGLPAAYAKSGLRLEPAALIVLPQGDIKAANTSFSPNVQVGYEALLGNFGIGGGGLARFTYWQLPGMTQDAAWTLETHGYVRAALHISRVALFVGGSLGLDTNLVHSGQANMSKTTAGFGMNLQSGLEVAATPSLALKAGFDYHPGTDKIIDGSPASISYIALLFGAQIRM